jgi:hypothetical protein
MSTIDDRLRRVAPLRPTTLAVPRGELHLGSLERNCPPRRANGRGADTDSTVKGAVDAPTAYDR